MPGSKSIYSTYLSGSKCIMMPLQEDGLQLGDQSSKHTTFYGCTRSLLSILRCLLIALARACCFFHYQNVKLNDVLDRIHLTSSYAHHILSSNIPTSHRHSKSATMHFTLPPHQLNAKLKQKPRTQLRTNQLLPHLPQSKLPTALATAATEEESERFSVGVGVAEKV